jgi:hypothetical protein
MLRRIARSARLILIAAIVLLLLSPAAASANGGPLFYPAEGYELLQLDEHSMISLLYEKVHFDIGQGANEHTGRATVTVTYELHNESNERKDIEVLFLTPSPEALSVTENGKTIAVTAAPEARPANWQPAAVDTVTEPLSGKTLKLSSGMTQYHAAAGTRFPLSFEPDETKPVVIQYSEDGGMYEKGVIQPIHSHLYYLSPAAFWAGEPNVELEVQLHAPGGKLYSNLPLAQSDGTQFTASLSYLPDEEWYFSYVYPSRLLFPTNMENEHNLLTLGTALALTIIAAAAALIFRKSYIFTVGMVGILAFTIYYISKIGGYPFNLIFVAFTDIMVGIGLLICHSLIRKSLRKRME